ncbi:hypothetical protein V496_08648 [Pseudogymnoascus sp. VKM F-4515 (FW-2607)]|nr:hypothetical protein V496_08648 [Pseudogymnoascus sp. VKM F-4515 (FW-2607)]
MLGTLIVLISILFLGRVYVRARRWEHTFSEARGHGGYQADDIDEPMALKATIHQPLARQPKLQIQKRLTLLRNNIAVDDGAGSRPLVDLSQHGQTFQLPGSEITSKSPDHNPQTEIEEPADPNPTPHQREEFDLLDSKNVEGETSSVVLASNIDQQNEAKFLFQPEVSNSVDEANSEGPDNMDGVKSFSGGRRYEWSWPRSRHESGNHRSGYIPPSIAERISKHDEPPSSAPVAEVEAGRISSPSILSKPAEPSPLRPHVLPEAAPYQHRRSLRRQPPAHRADLPDRPPPAALPHVLMSGHSFREEPDHIMRAARDIAMPAVAHVRNSTMDRELAFRRDVVAPRSGIDFLNTNHLQDGQLPPVAAGYDGIVSMHSYNTEAPLEPSTLESIYEDASDEPSPTTPMEEKPAERSYQKMTRSSFIGSARNSGEYLGGKPPSFKPSMVSLDLPSSSTIKPTEREPDIRPSRKYPADKSQTISSSEGVVTKVGILEQLPISKRGWLPYKRILPPVKYESSSIYSQSESPSLMSDIRASFIRGREDTHRYERLGYHHDDSKATFENISSGKYVEGVDQKGTGQLARSAEPKSPSGSTNIKRPTSQYAALFARRPSRRAGAVELTRSGSTQRARRRKAPHKSSQLERFSRRFRPGRLNSSLKKSVSAEELLTLKEATSEEYETNLTATDKQKSTTSGKKTQGPKNWFEGVLSFHKKGTDRSTSLFSNRKSDVRLKKEVAASGFIPYDKHPSHSGSSRRRDSEETEMLIMMIDGLEKRLDKALYPAHKGHTVAVAVDTPQQQITGRVEARTRRSPIRRTSRYIQQDGSEGDGGIGKGDLRSRFEKVSYGSDRNGAMRFTPPATSRLRSSDVDNISRRMSGTLPFTSAAPLPNKGVSNLESTEPEQGSDSLGDDVTLALPRDTGHSPESSNGARRKPFDPDYYYPFRDKPQRRPPYKRTFAVNIRKRATVIPGTRERELSKERILRYIKEHNHPPIQPRRSSRAMRVPSRDGSQASDGLPASQYSERALRVHTSMDGAHEADDEMESEIEYITPRRKRKRANRRRRRISYEEAHHMYFLHGETENSG